MKSVTLFTLAAALTLASGAASPSAGQTSKETAKEVAKTPSSTSAAFTLNTLLKTKVSGTFENMRLGEVLKDLADQVDQKGDKPVMWVYGKGFPYEKSITFSCNEKPLDAVLDQLLTKVNPNLGYVVVSKEGDKYDGWVRLTTAGERGFEKAGAPAAAENDEASAAEKLTLAKKLIDLGKPNAAKPVLEIILKNYPNTKAGAEAKELLEKLNK
jgi:hypothetical protein